MTCSTKSIVPVVILAVIFIVGCSDGRTPGTPQAPTTGAAVAQTSEPDVGLIAQVNKRVGDEETTVSGTNIPGPNAAQIEQQVKAIDWKDSQLRPTVALGRAKGDSRNLSLKGTLGTPNVDGEFRAYWLGLVDGNAGLRKSPPLESVGAAIELLNMFCTDPEKLKGMAMKWEAAE